jgi:hypothetical protein
MTERRKSQERWEVYTLREVVHPFVENNSRIYEYYGIIHLFQGFLKQQ